MFDNISINHLIRISYYFIKICCIIIFLFKIIFKSSIINSMTSGNELKMFLSVIGNNNL